MVCGYHDIYVSPVVCEVRSVYHFLYRRWQEGGAGARAASVRSLSPPCVWTLPRQRASLGSPHTVSATVLRCLACNSAPPCRNNRNKRVGRAKATPPTCTRPVSPYGHPTHMLPQCTCQRQRQRLSWAVVQYGRGARARTARPELPPDRTAACWKSSRRVGLRGRRTQTVRAAGHAAGAPKSGACKSEELCRGAPRGVGLVAGDQDPASLTWSVLCPGVKRQCVD